MIPPFGKKRSGELRGKSTDASTNLSPGRRTRRVLDGGSRFPPSIEIRAGLAQYLPSTLVTEKKHATAS
jgi:hypothetical protein